MKQLLGSFSKISLATPGSDELAIKKKCVSFLSPGEVLHDERSELEMKHVKLHKQQICNSQQQLDQEMQRVLDLEGEGKGANKIYRNTGSGGFTPP